jgi:hypothetical protein
MINRRGEAEWFWIMISIVIALVVAIFILMLFTDFGSGIKESFDGINELADPDEIPDVYGGLDDDDDTEGDEVTGDVVANPLVGDRSS